MSQVKVSLTKKEAYKIKQKIDDYENQENNTIIYLYKRLNIHEDAQQEFNKAVKKRSFIIKVTNYFDLYKLSRYLDIQIINDKILNFYSAAKFTDNEILKQVNLLYEDIRDDTEMAYFDDFLESENIINYISKKLETCIKYESFGKLPISIITQILGERHRKNIPADPLYNFITKKISDRFFFLRFLNFSTFSIPRIKTNDFRQIMVSLFQNYDELIDGLIGLIEKKEDLFDFLKEKYSNPIVATLYTKLKEKPSDAELVLSKREVNTKSQKVKFKTSQKVVNDVMDDSDDRLQREISRTQPQGTIRMKGKSKKGSGRQNEMFAKTQVNVKPRIDEYVSGEEGKYDRFGLSSTKNREKVRKDRQIQAYSDDDEIDNKKTRTKRRNRNNDDYEDNVDTKKSKMQRRNDNDEYDNDFNTKKSKMQRRNDNDDYEDNVDTKKSKMQRRNDNDDYEDNVDTKKSKMQRRNDNDEYEDNVDTKKSKMQRRNDNDDYEDNVDTKKSKMQRRNDNDDYEDNVDTKKSKMQRRNDSYYDDYDDEEIVNKSSKSQKKLKDSRKDSKASVDRRSRNEDYYSSYEEASSQPTIDLSQLRIDYAPPVRPLTADDKARAEIWKETEAILRSGKYTLKRKKIKIEEDVKKSMKGTETVSPQDRLYYPSNIQAANLKRSEIYKRVSVVNMSTFEAARQLVANNKGEKVCVLNFASAVKPGGGVLHGRQAQEETLSRMSSLYFTLLMDDTMYKHNKKLNSPYYSDYMIFSPDVVVFRNDDYELIRSYKVSVISAAAVNCSDLKKMRKYNENKVNEVMKNRCRRILQLCLANGIRTIVLGAFGCGVFENKPENVSAIFKDIIVNERLGCYFDQIVFAIIAASGKGYSLSQFKQAFKKE